LLRLFYRDNSLAIERGAEGHDARKFDYVWDFDRGKLLEVKAGALLP